MKKNTGWICLIVVLGLIAGCDYSKSGIRKQLDASVSPSQEGNGDGSNFVDVGGHNTDQSDNGGGEGEDIGSGIHLPIAHEVNPHYTMHAAPTPTAAGQFSDIGHPHVTATSPILQQSNVSVLAVIKVTFSEVMDVATLSTSTFQVVSGDANQSGPLSFDPVMGQVSCNTPCMIATFTPNQALPTNKLIAVNLDAGVTDLAGNGLMAGDGETHGYTFTFTTSHLAPAQASSPAFQAVDPQFQAAP